MRRAVEDQAGLSAGRRPLAVAPEDRQVANGDDPIALEPRLCSQAVVAVSRGAVPFELLGSSAQQQLRALSHQAGIELDFDGPHHSENAALLLAAAQTLLPDQTLVLAFREARFRCFDATREPPQPRMNAIRNWDRGVGVAPVTDSALVFRDDTYLQEIDVAASLFNVDTAPEQVALEEEFARAGLKVRVLACGSSASDHNALVADVARAVRHAETGRRVSDEEAMPLVMEGVFGATRGWGARLHRYGAAGFGRPSDPTLDSKFVLKCPTRPWRMPPNAEEASQLLQDEDEALGELRRHMHDPDGPRVFFLETIQGCGLQFCSARFFAEVAKIRDETKRPIMVDETLTGFGRTGELFAFQHYAGFVPDYVVVGKASQMTMLLHIDRGAAAAGMPLYQPKTPTVAVDRIQAIRARAVLRYLRKPGVLRGIRENGGHLLRKLREVERHRGAASHTEGLGFLLATQLTLEGIQTPKKNLGDRTRLLPPYDLARADIDEVLAPMLIA